MSETVLLPVSAGQDLIGLEFTHPHYGERAVVVGRLDSAMYLVCYGKHTSGAKRVFTIERLDDLHRRGVTFNYPEEV